MDLQLYSAEQEYSNNPDLKKSDVESLQEWITKQPHLPKPTEAQLIWFLRSCKNSIELTKTTLDNYFTIKTHVDFFDTPSRAYMEKALSMGLFSMLPKRTPEGYDITVCALTDYDADNFDSACMIRALITALMTHLHLHGSSKGIILISDMKGTGMGHVLKLNLMACKKMLYFVEEAAPFPLQSIHLVNINSYTDRIMTLVKPMMAKHIADLLHFHKSVDSLHDYIPKECLPEEYGGRESNLSKLKEACSKVLLENLCVLRMEDEMKVDESKRPGKPKMINDVFGMEGSFRKLDID